jgi:RluA family pseudouridine synthase
MITDRLLKVGDSDAKRRLDAFILSQVPTTTRAMAIEAIEQQRVTLNGRQAAKGLKLRAGDQVRLIELMETSDWKAGANPAVRIPVLRESAAFLIIDKPAGLPVHPLHPRETRTVVSGLLAAYPELAGIGPDPLFPAIVHRLDTDTSGVMLVARTPAAYDFFREEFRNRRVTKRYLALVDGCVARPARMEQHLVHVLGDQHRMRVIEPAATPSWTGRPMLAITEYSVREALPRHTLLDVTIRTGVTHQIRCQLADAGHHVAGDSLYGPRPADARFRGRLFLHAAEIEFNDPETGQRVSCHAPLSPELEQVLAELRTDRPNG